MNKMLGCEFLNGGSQKGVEGIISIKLVSTFLFFFVVVGYGITSRFIVLNDTEVEFPAIRADAKDYYLYAYNLSIYKVFSRQESTSVQSKSVFPEPDAMRSPGFPVFASFFIAKDDVHKSLQRLLLAQTWLQIIVFTIFTCLLLIRFGSALAIPLVSVLWFFPHWMTINHYYLTESLFTSLIVIVACFSILLDIYKSYLFYLFVGMFLGMAALVRPVLEYFPLLLLVSVVFLRGYSKAVFCIIIPMILIVAFWKLRNYFVLGFISDSALMINGLYHGSFPSFMLDGDVRTLGVSYRFDPEQSNYNSLYSTITLLIDKFMIDPWGMIKWYFLDKPFYLWRWSIIAGQGGPFIYPVTYSPLIYLEEFDFISRFSRIVHMVWVPLGFCSAVFIAVGSLLNSSQIPKRQPGGSFVISILVIYVVLIHVVTAPYPRYGIPFKICLLYLAGCLIQKVIVK